MSPDCYEVLQREHVTDIWSRAQNVGAAYAINWMLWDAAVGGGIGNTTGWGEEHNPKHVLGTMAEILGVIPNSDAETIDSSTPAKPQGWDFGGTNPSTLTFQSMNNTIDYRPDASTNERYARLSTTAQSTSQQVWVTAPTFTVAGGETLYANAYVRSDMTNVRLAVNEFDSSFGFIQSVAGPAFTPSGWSFNSYLHRVGDLPPAIAAASAGDVLLVRSGSYSKPILDKGLSIQADQGAVVTVAGLCVESIPVGERVLIAGLSSTNGGSIASCAGKVWIEDCRFEPPGGSGQTALSVLDCADAVLVNVVGIGGGAASSSFALATGPGLHTSNSAVHVFECTFQGGNGAWSDPFATFPVEVQRAAGSLTPPPSWAARATRLAIRTTAPACPPRLQRAPRGCRCSRRATCANASSRAAPEASASPVRWA